LSLETVSDVAPLKDTDDVPLLMTRFPPALVEGTTNETAPRMLANKYWFAVTVKVVAESMTTPAVEDFSVKDDVADESMLDSFTSGHTCITRVLEAAVEE
jgi:hypothetical protein